MSSNGKGSSRVSIPADLRKTIQQIREITGKQHSDDDIISVFKECSNDPHETAQKLLYLDTFQEVKSKRERKKEKLVPNTQGKGRNGRRNFASNYNGPNNERSADFKRQNGANHITGGPITAWPALDKAIKTPNPLSPPSGVSNHKIQHVIISPVNNGVTEEKPLSKSTSLSKDVAELDNSKASVVSVALSASDSIVQNNTQNAVDGTSQISQKSYDCSSQSVQVTRSEAAADKSKNQSLIESDVGERPQVKFPVHFDKMQEIGLKFGSFGSDFVKETCSDHGTIGCDDSSVEFSNGIVACEVSAREDLSTLSQDKDNEISDSAPETELALQSDQRVHLVEGLEEDKPKEKFLQITDTHQAASSEAPSIPNPDQCSIAASQQAMHHFRQQYPPNFFPYGPFFPAFYMPQPFIPQFLNPVGIHQPPGGDDATTPPGSTLPLPQIESGSNAENSPATIVPSPNCPLNHIPLAATINTTHKEEKTENNYTNELLSAWMAAQSLANLHMYNLALQGQPLPFPTAFNGIYQQQTHPILAAPLDDHIALPHINNQQPQAALGNNN